MAEVVLVVGNWPAMLNTGQRTLAMSAGDAVLEVCPAEARLIQQRAVALHPSWLLIGELQDDSDVEIFVFSVQVVCSTVRLAMLGEPYDLKRCELWMRRGFWVYLTTSSSVGRVLSALHTAAMLDAVVIDRVFHHGVESRRVAVLQSLTHREVEVLGLLSRGFRNTDIASALHISENTIEFHMRHLLSKLGARNRVEAVERALRLGLC